jgi:hypothetical protein
VAHPEVPDGLDAMSSDALRAILADYSSAADAADRRANGSVPAAGIAGAVITSGAAAVSVIAVSAATILMALFAVNAQVEPNPHEQQQATASLVERANEALRRKTAWAQLSSYFAFAVAVAVGVLAISV